MNYLARLRQLPRVACLPVLLLAAHAQSGANPDDEGVLKLSPFAVNAQSDTGYKVSSASTATRTNTPLIDIPQTVDIFTKEFWNDTAAVTFDQSFRYAANVYVRNRNAGSGDGVNLRGFETNGSISVDGVRLGNYKRDLVGYERLEIVKGPPSAVQGRAGGTGLLNYILKKPEFRRDGGYVKYNLNWADSDHATQHRGEFDVNYSFRGSKRFAARVAGSYLEGDDYIKFNRFENYTLYPSFRWQVTKTTELILATELLDLTTPSRDEGHGFAIYPEKARRLIPLFDNSTDPITNLRLPYNFNLIGPDNVDREKIATSTLFLNQKISDNIFFRQVGNFRYLGQRSFTYAAENNLVTKMPSQYSGTISGSHGATAQGDLVAKYEFRNWFTGDTLVGYSYNDSDSTTSNYSGIPDAPFNILDIAAIAATGNSRSYYNGRKVSVVNRSSYLQSDAYSFGMYAQQDLGFWKNRILLTGGIRSDHDHTSTKNATTGVQTTGADTTLNSYRYGLTFKITPQLAAYAVYSVQNDANRSIQRYNGLLAGDPRLSEFFTVSPNTELKEAGLKGELFSGRLSFSGNYWEMTRAGSVVNILQPGTSMGQPVTVGTQTEIQGAMSKGYEFSAFGSITDRLSLVANYTRMTTSQQNPTSTNLSNRIALRFAPTWNANAFVKYLAWQSGNKSLSLKAGLSGIGPFYAQVTGPGLVYVPHRQKSMDLGAAYRVGRYTADLMITNLNNDPFLITRDQPPRTFHLSLSATF